ILTQTLLNKENIQIFTLYINLDPITFTFLKSTHGLKNSVLFTPSLVDTTFTNYNQSSTKSIQYSTYTFSISMPWDKRKDLTKKKIIKQRSQIQHRPFISCHITRGPHFLRGKA
ncbi:hypothetical protein PanWU01x14_082620, partial [Parasponia andersonii]